LDAAGIDISPIVGFAPPLTAAENGQKQKLPITLLLKIIISVKNKLLINKVKFLGLAISSGINWCNHDSYIINI